MSAIQLVIASQNENKIKEFQSILKPLHVQVLTAKELDLTNVDEMGETFKENALLKAISASKESGLPAIGDDSGLCIHALKNNPGVYSARFAQKYGGFEKAFEVILNDLKDTEDKTAHYSCVIAFAFPNGNAQTFEGRIDGTIVSPKGKGGFGYDPIFMPQGYQKTFAELPESLKNKISHRGRAMADFLNVVHDFIQK